MMTAKNRNPAATAFMNRFARPNSAGRTRAINKSPALTAKAQALTGLPRHKGAAPITANQTANPSPKARSGEGFTWISF